MSAHQPEPPLLDAAIRIDHLPPEGRDLEVVADATQREAIARRLDVSGVDALSASLKLTRFRGGMRVAGTLDAVTVQLCVVTFVPVRQAMHEPVDRIFLPAADQPKASSAHPEVFVDLDADDAPDYFEGYEIDLSEVIVETVALALDPYPRAEGASLEEAGLPPEEAETSPFAALKSLLDPDDEGR